MILTEEPIAALGLLGAGAFCREFVGFAARMVDQNAGICPILVQFDDSGTCMACPEPHPTATIKQFLESGVDWCLITIGDPQIRAKIAKNLKIHNKRAASAIFGAAHGPSKIGHGTIICPGAVVTSNAALGRHFQAHVLSHVAHDCVIGDCVTLAPRAGINGRCKIGDRVFIGSGATICDGITIGDDAIIGAGAVVIENIAAGQTVVGNPARVLREKTT
jgi:sugar O-acyltransferase (sialic acid O-acetyltransferase NeuD family)